MLKRITAMLLSLVVLSFVLTSCAAKPAAEPAAPSAAAEASSAAPTEAKVTELNFWTFQDLHKDFMYDAVETWNKANADRQISLKVDVYPYDENHNKLLIALQSGTGAPDLVDIEIGRFANYLKGTPQLEPLNDIIEPVKDKLVMSRFENYAKDGNYYGVDYHVGASVIYYNTEICKKGGIDIDAIDTWADYVEAGKKLVAATGIPMCTLETTEHWSYYPIVSQAGSDWMDAKGDVIMDNDTNIKVLEFLEDMMYGSKIAVAAPGGFHHAEEYYAFMGAGGAASVWMPQWYMNRFTDYMPDLKGKIAVRPMPRWEEGGFRSGGMGGTGTAVTNQSKDIQLAKDFLAAAKLSKEGSIKTWSILGFDPLRWDVWSDPAMKEPNKFTDYYGTGVFDMLSTIKDEINPIHVTEKFPAAQTLVQSSVVFKVLSERSMTPSEALKAAAAELRAQ